MTGAEWIAEKINAAGKSGIEATVECDDVVFVQRSVRPDAYVGVVPIRPANSASLVKLNDAKDVRAQKPAMTMMIAIPRGTRWTGSAMRWLQSVQISFGGVGDLLSAIRSVNELSTHRNKTFAFVDDGLRRHSRVADLEWIDSKKVGVRLQNDVTITVALEDAYDITMGVARDAARTLGTFDVLLKTNPNGSITSDGAENIERLGFQTQKWGELFAYLAKRGGRAGQDDLKKRLRGTRSAV